MALYGDSKKFPTTRSIELEKEGKILSPHFNLRLDRHDENRWMKERSENNEKIWNEELSEEICGDNLKSIFGDLIWI